MGMTQDTAAMLATMRRLLNVRLAQTGARAAATQRKIEALRAALLAAGMTDSEIRGE